MQLAMALREYLGAADLYEEAMAERMGLGRTDLRCYDLLERRGTMTAGALAVASGLTTGAMTFLIDRLEAAGIVRRRRDATDRRRVLVEVVQAAAEQGFALHQPMVADMRALAQRYKLEELAIVSDFLSEARQIYETHAPMLRAHITGVRWSRSGRPERPTRTTGLSSSENAKAHHRRFDAPDSVGRPVHRSSRRSRAAIQGSGQPAGVGHQGKGDPMPFVFDFDHKHRKPPMEMKDLLGGKGANLAEMTSVLGLPVPPGFTISTDACRAYMDGGWPDGLTEEVARARARLEKAMGKVIGDPSDPLLVSVRSGAKFSMPGMMDTVLNLGLNDQSVEGLAKQTGDERFAFDSYRRFVAMYGRIVLDIPGEEFDVAVRRGEGAGRDGLGRPRADGAAPLPRRLVPADRRAAHRPAVPPGPCGPAQRGDRGGVPELERPAGDRLPRPRAHPALARDRGQRPGDGLRQPGRPVRDRCRLHPRPGDRRQGRVRRLPRQRPG